MDIWKSALPPSGGDDWYSSTEPSLTVQNNYRRVDTSGKMWYRHDQLHQLILSMKCPRRHLAFTHHLQRSIQNLWAAKKSSIAFITDSHNDDDARPKLTFDQILIKIPTTYVIYWVNSVNLSNQYHTTDSQSTTALIIIVINAHVPHPKLQNAKYRYDYFSAQLQRTKSTIFAFRQIHDFLHFQ